MALQVCNLAMLKCAFALPPGTSVFTVLPLNRVLTENQPAANIMDFVPMLNIMTFGMCTSQSNPTVAAATAAALGTPTPAPCIPVTTMPWKPGAPTVLIANFPALDNSSTCQCMWGGVITVVNPGQKTVMIP